MTSNFNNIDNIDNINDMDDNYELKCANFMYDCLILVTTPDMYLAKKQILENCAKTDVAKYITDFKPYKNRFMLNIPLLRKIVSYSLYYLLNQFYYVGDDEKYYLICESEGTHEDVEDLVVKITTIISNKLLGKNIITIKPQTNV